MDTLLDRFGDQARRHPARPLLREQTADGWRHLSWGELDAAVGRVAAALPEDVRGKRLLPPPGPFVERAPAALALLHRGAVLGGEARSVEPGREIPGLLVRLRQELRPADAAVGALDHAALLRVAEALAGQLHGELRVTAAPWLALWAAIAGEATLVLGEGRCPTWLCSPEQLTQAAPPPSRLGALGALARPWGRAADFPAVVVVAGALPAATAGLRARGVKVDPAPARWADAIVAG